VTPPEEARLLARRRFLCSASSGIGLAALASLLTNDGLLADDGPTSHREALTHPLAPRLPHFAPKAKSCICIYLEGGPSQIDLFDPKPKLNELDGQKLPDSMTEKVRFAFIQKEGATLMGCPRKFSPRGECGMELSDLFPDLGRSADDLALIRSMHTEAFNHHPGQLLMNTGFANFGRPSMGSWLTYGLGSESQDLPGYVVLSSGRGTSGGASNWSSGFLPSTYQGVLFRNQGEPVVNLKNPPGLGDGLERLTIETLTELNQERQQVVGDREIASRIGAYELAFRMQSAAPELIDLSRETQSTRDAYGVDRDEGELMSSRGGRRGTFASFAANCLLARRLVERGVRFVNLFHASWDHHSDLDRELTYCTRMADQPVAALIRDLKARGLLESTLVVWTSEFGRTPLGENRKGYKAVTGRDHHPFAFSIWMAGGGTRGGQVIGKTDEIGWGIVEDPVHVHDFQATVLSLFGFNHERLTYRFQGRDFRLTDIGGKVVRKLVS
jgi:hypothetical protein